MKSAPEWLLGRMHRIKLATQATKSISDDAGIGLLNLQKQLDEAEAHLRRTETTGGGEMRPEVGRRVANRRSELQDQISELKPKIEAKKEISARATEFEISTTAIYERCCNWFDVVGDSDSFERIDIVATKDDPLARLEQLNQEIRELGHEHEEVSLAPTARVDIEHAVREHLDKLRAECTPTISFESGKVHIDLAKSGRRTDSAGFPPPRVWPETLLAFAIWLDPETVEQRILAITDRIPAAANALPADVKRQKLHELEAKRQACLYEVGAVTREAIESGTPVPISKALEAVHVLGVRISRAQAAAA